MKTCGRCREAKPLEAFCSDRSRPDGRYPVCRDCEKRYRRERYAANPQAQRDATKRWLAKNPGKMTEYSRRYVERNPEVAKGWERNRSFRRYGVTQEWYEATIEAQDGRCAICGSTSPGGRGRRWSIDHDHACCPGQAQSCGRCVRGLLCARCNAGLGNFSDDPEVLTMAITYLRDRSVEAR